MNPPIHRGFFKSILFLILLSGIPACSDIFADSRPRVIHVFTVLCDNKSQGIVPVPARLGDGDDPHNNLYWGAAYGVKTYFQRSREWRLIESVPNVNHVIPERVVFRHRMKNAYLIADAYRGSEMRRGVEDFLKAASGRNAALVRLRKKEGDVNINTGGGADFVVFVGHNGLMDFSLETIYDDENRNKRKSAAVLACYSRKYFIARLRKSGAVPVLLTEGLMSPEAYTLKDAIEGWLRNEDGDKIHMRAAHAYNRYQKCGLRGAKRLFYSAPRG